MQEPNADTGYEQNALERILLNPGWRFRGLQLFSTGPWKPWAFVLFSLIMAVALVLLSMAYFFDVLA